MGIAIYATVLVTGLQQLFPLGDNEQPLYVTLFNRPPLPKGVPLTPDQRNEAIQVTCACNTLILGLMIGVVLLQCGDYYVTRKDARALASAKEQQKTVKSQ